ncbi:hypothetical protein [Bradyrhizobium lupini]
MRQAARDNWLWSKNFFDVIQLFGIERNPHISVRGDTLSSLSKAV